MHMLHNILDIFLYIKKVVHLDNQSCIVFLSIQLKVRKHFFSVVDNQLVKQNIVLPIKVVNRLKLSHLKDNGLKIN